MIIIVNHNKQKIKITLTDPYLDQLYKLVQESLKLPFDFELQDQYNNTDFKLEDRLEVFVIEITHMKSKTMNEYSAKRDRIKSLNLVNVKKESCSEFSTGNEKSSINELVLSRLHEDKLFREEQYKINKEGNKLIQQIKKRMQMQDQIIKMRENILTLPELEKKKIILAQKRELSKPIRFDILAEHEKKYEEEKLEKQKLKEIQKIQWLEEQKMKLIKFPKSQALVRLEQEQQKLKQQQLQQFEQKKLIREKQIRYGEQIKELLLKEFPRHSVSPIKNQSLQSQQLEIAKKNIIRLQNLLGEKELFVIKERRSVNEIRPRGQNSLIEINKSQPQVIQRKPLTSEHINNKLRRKSLKISETDDMHEVQSLQLEQIKSLEQKSPEKKIGRSSSLEAEGLRNSDQQIKLHLI